MSPNNQHSGVPIAALRRRLNMTQEEFAHAIGVTVSTVNRWENGHAKPAGPNAGEFEPMSLKEIAAADPKKIFRVTFNEITPKAIRAAFEHPRQVDTNLVDAQQARRVLDRIVGYKVSPLLWNKVRRGLSAGRVQTVALRLIVEREEEIRAFVPKEY